MNSRLVLMVGLPRSGKTTQAQKMPYPIVSPDAIRLALHGQRFAAEAEPHVWAIAKTMVAALFLAGHSVVVLDACNVSRKRRDEWKDARWVREFYVIDTPAAECALRAERSGREDVIPIIDRMSKAWEPITEDEIELAPGQFSALRVFRGK
jgi:predicted kinase